MSYGYTYGLLYSACTGQTYLSQLHTDFALLILAFHFLSSAPLFRNLPSPLDQLQYYQTVWRIENITNTVNLSVSPHPKHNRGQKGHFWVLTQCLLPSECLGVFHFHKDRFKTLKPLPDQEHSSADRKCSKMPALQEEEVQQCLRWGFECSSSRTEDFSFHKDILGTSLSHCLGCKPHSRTSAQELQSYLTETVPTVQKSPVNCSWCKNTRLRGDYFKLSC